MLNTVNPYKALPAYQKIAFRGDDAPKTAPNTQPTQGDTVQFSKKEEDTLKTFLKALSQAEQSGQLTPDQKTALREKLKQFVTMQQASKTEEPSPEAAPKEGTLNPLEVIHSQVNYFGKLLNLLKSGQELPPKAQEFLTSGEKTSVEPNQDETTLTEVIGTLDQGGDVQKESLELGYNAFLNLAETIKAESNSPTEALPSVDDFDSAQQPVLEGGQSLSNILGGATTPTVPSTPAPSVPGSLTGGQSLGNLVHKKGNPVDSSTNGGGGQSLSNLAGQHKGAKSGGLSSYGTGDVARYEKIKQEQGLGAYYKAIYADVKAGRPYNPGTLSGGGSVSPASTPADLQAAQEEMRQLTDELDALTPGATAPSTPEAKKDLTIPPEKYESFEDFMADFTKAGGDLNEFLFGK